MADEPQDPGIRDLNYQESTTIARSAPLQATLEWKSGDLDLYCFYVTAGDEIGKVYHREMGSLNEEPYIVLDQDSKKGGAETCAIGNPDALKYVLLAAYREFDSGTGSFAKVDARAIIRNAGGEAVRIGLEKKNNFSYWAAIALLDFTSPEVVKIGHVETYAEADVERAPILRKDGTFKMGAGAIEFKEPGKKCFVATGVYGDADAPEVLTLRRFRDRALRPTAPGRAFIRAYERFSPPAAGAISRRPRARRAVRRMLDAMVHWVDRP